MTLAYQSLGFTRARHSKHKMCTRPCVLAVLPCVDKFARVLLFEQQTFLTQLSSTVTNSLALPTHTRSSSSIPT